MQAQGATSGSPGPGLTGTHNSKRSHPCLLDPGGGVGVPGFLMNQSGSDTPAHPCVQPLGEEGR